jgi:hypothetical protein
MSDPNDEKLKTELIVIFNEIRDNWAGKLPDDALLDALLPRFALAEARARLAELGVVENYCWSASLSARRADLERQLREKELEAGK